jgi:hypothetical protein
MDPELFPTKLKRDLRVASPQPLYRALQDFLEEQGFHVDPKQPPTMEVGALPGTATFLGRLLGVQDFTQGTPNRGRSAAMLLSGSGIAVAMVVLLVLSVTSDAFFPSLGLVVGGILGATGAGQLRAKPQRLRRLVEVYLEGESYHASAARATPSAGELVGMDLRAERSGIVSDVRVTVYAGVGYAEGTEAVSNWLSEKPEVALSMITSSSPEALSLPADALPAHETLKLPARLDNQLDFIIQQFQLSEP